MNRRSFLRTMGLGSIGLASIGYLMANNNFLTQSVVNQLQAEELKSALTKYINRYFKGELFVPNGPLSSGVITAVSRFEIEPVIEKNNIFDFADLVIEQCKKKGFDATSLRSGIIPTGMTVSSNGYQIRTSETMYSNKIEGLKDYDALMRCHNPIVIKTTLPPNEWNAISDFKKTFENDLITIFRDKKSKMTISKSLKEQQTPMKILGINPGVAFAPNQNI